VAVAVIVGEHVERAAVGDAGGEPVLVGRGARGQEPAEAEIDQRDASGSVPWRSRGDDGSVVRTQHEALLNRRC
jgi:hypothetical protein